VLGRLRRSVRCVQVQPWTGEGDARWLAAAWGFWLVAKLDWARRKTCPARPPASGLSWHGITFPFSFSSPFAFVLRLPGWLGDRCLGLGKGHDRPDGTMTGRVTLLRIW
jgi:hypothetical protein